MQELIGCVDHWNDQKGYGFILADDGRKVFFHISTLRGAQRPHIGESVHFVLAQDEQGRLSASHVRRSHLEFDNGNIRTKSRVTTAKKSNSFTARSSTQAKKSHNKEHPIPWKTLALLLILPAWAAVDLLKEYGAPWVIVVYAITSLFSYYFYWDDKRRARLGDWRIPEANLHFWSLVGGWPGAFIAQQQFRHKTKKLSFLLVFWLIVLSHQVLWFDWLFMDGKWLVSVLG